MSQTLAYALQITVIGMGLVFAAILLLWGLMALLVRLTADPVVEPVRDELSASESSESSESPAVPATPALSPAERPEREHEQRRRAAALAVAIALAQHPQTAPRRPSPRPPSGSLSGWQAVHRARQLKNRGPRR
jgi:Na+-transporting methylmalonyl-CoA/oxaloacetate decarboxylase gamma subunit